MPSFGEAESGQFFTQGAQLFLLSSSTSYKKNNEQVGRLHEHQSMQNRWHDDNVGSRVFSSLGSLGFPSWCDLRGRASRVNGTGNSRWRGSTIGEKDGHTSCVCHVNRKALFTENHDFLDDAMTQLCPVVTKHSHRARCVRSSQDGVTAVVHASVLDFVIVSSS